MVFGDRERSRIIALDSTTDDLDIPADILPSGSRVHVTCTVKQDVDLARIEGVVLVSAVLECSRCLAQFAVDIEGEFIVVVRRLKQGEVEPWTMSENDEDESDGLVIIRHDEDTVDITEYVRDTMLLSLPVKPLCDDTCRGLCPVCGTNRNETVCGCSIETADSRWSELNDLHVDMEEAKKRHT